MTSSSQTSEYGVSRGSDCSRRQRRNWSPSRKLVRIHTHSGWNSYLLTSKRSEMIFFSAWVFAKLWLRLCQTSCCLCWSRLCWAHCSQTRAGFSQKEEHSWTWNSLIQAASGVSGILRWRIGTTDTILSLMVSVPYRFALVFSMCTVQRTCGGGEVNWDVVSGAFENDSGAVDNLEKVCDVWWCKGYSGCWWVLASP